MGSTIAAATVLAGHLPDRGAGVSWCSCSCRWTPLHLALMLDEAGVTGHDGPLDVEGFTGSGPAG